MKYFIAVCFLIFNSCENSSKKAAQEKAQDLVSLPSGLQYSIDKEGEGKSAKSGDTVFIFETVTYRDKTLIFSNEGNEYPIPVLIGGGQATKGEDEGLRGMKVGEIRTMIIPPNLSQRKSYPPNLSPDSTIVVKVILDKISSQDTVVQ